MLARHVTLRDKKNNNNSKSIKYTYIHVCILYYFIQLYIMHKIDIANSLWAVNCNAWYWVYNVKRNISIPHTHATIVYLHTHVNSIHDSRFPQNHLRNQGVY